MQGSVETTQTIEGAGFGENLNIGVLRLPNPILDRDHDVLVNPIPLIAEVPLGPRRLHAMAEQLTLAMGGLIDKGLVDVRVHDDYIEVELKSDILFSSGVGDVSQAAEPVIAELSKVLRAVPKATPMTGLSIQLFIAPTGSSPQRVPPVLCTCWAQVASIPRVCLW